MTVWYLFAFTALVLTSGISQAQPAHPSWFNQYHFVGPPKSGETRPTPVVSDLQDIQQTLLAILRKANFAGDYEAALYAAAQAAATAQLKAALAEHAQSPQAHNTSADDLQPDSNIYLIALKDQSIQVATSYWSDGYMLHYINLQGGHEQVRMDLVNRSLTSELARQRKMEFRPESEEHVAKR